MQPLNGENPFFALAGLGSVETAEVALAA